MNGYNREGELNKARQQKVERSTTIGKSTQRKELGGWVHKNRKKCNKRESLFGKDVG